MSHIEDHIEANVKLHRFAKPKDDSDYSYTDDPEKLSEWDGERLASHGVIEAWYWYATGSYCGDGELVGRCIDGKFISMEMNHCSCYGPTDTNDPQKFATLDELEAFPYDERRQKMAPLIQAAKGVALN